MFTRVLTVLAAVSFCGVAQAADVCVLSSNVTVCKETWTYQYGEEASTWDDVVISCNGACDVTVESTDDGYRVRNGFDDILIPSQADNIAVVQVNGSPGRNVVDVSGLEGKLLVFMTSEDTLYTANAPRPAQDGLTWE